MKAIYLGLALLLVMAVGDARAQTARSSWSVGLSLVYPRYEEVNIQPLNTNYGALLSLQRNFSEHVALRLAGGYSHLEGSYSGASGATTERTNLWSGDLDLLYYLVPCEAVSPYLFAGIGAMERMSTHQYTPYLDENAFDAEFNYGAGLEWKFDPEWSLAGEFGNHRTFNSELDGAVMSYALEPNGQDSYWTLGVGVKFYFGKGEPSKICGPTSVAVAPAAKDLTDYNRIEGIVKEYIPREVTRDVVVEKYIRIPANTWYLDGVKFAFDRSELLPESYPVLNDAVKLLTDNPDLNVEIKGYTDSIGTPIYNDTLSLQRAVAVKDYLVSQGIASRRLTAVGYGLTGPIATNVTAEGREINRRVEFRVVNK
ncbi:MAG TPA: OmpA family protein [Candidatus Kryptobacter bacterium]|nr:OmpA family protein [Candidatus Kryptobacter bacterium]